MPVALERLALGSAAVLSPTRAAELLPCRETEALRWLRDQGLVRRVDGLGELVVWGDVVAAIQAGRAPGQVAPPTSTGVKLRRSRLAG